MQVPKSTVVALLSLLGLMLLCTKPLSASTYLLFTEAQIAANWQETDDKWKLYSHHPHEVMQKPSLGFDYIQRLRDENGDFGIIAIQARLAYNQDVKPRFEPQLYNAYLKYKASAFNLWVGHNKPAFGLNTYLDNHAALLSDLAMKGFNFDRDWGMGLELEYKDLSFDNSLTTGSGMKLVADGSFLHSSRFALYDMSRDNRSFGISYRRGKTLEAMGYQIMHNAKLHPEYQYGFDAALRWENVELKTDLSMGEFMNKAAEAILVRGTWYALEEDRLQIEGQYLSTEKLSKTYTEYSMGLNYRINTGLTARVASVYHLSSEDLGVMMQLYYYHTWSALRGLCD